MKIVMTLLVRDEADIIEDFVIYHLNQGVDHILAVDDGSSDGSAELLESFTGSGYLSLPAKPQGRYREREADWLTELARLAAGQHQADWVLPGDADEFWWPLRGDLKCSLESISPDREAVIVPRNDFVFTSPATRRAVLDFTVRERASELRAKVAFRAAPDVAIHRGAHRVAHDLSLTSLTPWDIGRPLRLSPIAPMRIFHFGVRDQAQLERVIDLRGRQEHRRDALYRRAAQRPASAELTGSWREQELDRGLADGSLVVDARLAQLYPSCVDPRRRLDATLRAPAACPGDGPDAIRAASREMLEVQTLMIDAVQHEETAARLQARRLRRALAKERQARTRGPLAGARRALASLSGGRP